MSLKDIKKLNIPNEYKIISLKFTINIILSVSNGLKEIIEDIKPDFCNYSFIINKDNKLELIETKILKCNILLGDVIKCDNIDNCHTIILIGDNLKIWNLIVNNNEIKNIYNDDEKCPCCLDVLENESKLLNVKNDSERIICTSCYSDIKIYDINKLDRCFLKLCNFTCLLFLLPVFIVLSPVYLYQGYKDAKIIKMLYKSPKYTFKEKIQILKNL